MPPPGRLFGVVLLAAAFLPLHRLLDPARTGPAGVSTRSVAEDSWVLGLSGTLIVVVFSWVVVRMSGAGTEKAEAGRTNPVVRAAGRLSPRACAWLAGVVVLAGAAAVASLVHAGAPTSVDEMVQLAHARALASGSLGLPTGGTGAAWALQNGLLTESGWVSIYPPLHTLLLAIGISAGAAWLVGPIDVATATVATVLVVDRLVGPAPARLVGLLLAVSPFWLLVGASHLSHSAAAAGLSLTLLFALRARDGSALWAIATGAAIGLAVSARPWVGLAVGSTLLAVVWGIRGDAGVDGSEGGGGRVDGGETGDRHGRGGPGGALVPRLAGLVLGGAPFALLLFAWNQVLFGSPFRLGYSAAFGPSHGLGFHTDPWGNRYGPIEALGWSGADLLQLGIRLLENPIPVVAVVGAGLLARAVPKSARALVAWCAAALAANAVYWHHGVHFGPRMLFESTPAWLALFAVVVAGLFASPKAATEYRVARWALGISIVVGLAFAPFVVTSATRSAPEDIPEGRPGEVVFVHGSWSSRVASRLHAAGMPRDSIETLLRRNDICAVDQAARRIDPTSRAALDGLDTTPLPGSPVTLELRLVSPGNGVRVDPSRPPSPVCQREARADRLGVLELENVAWRLGGGADAPVRYARDLGPAANLVVLDALGRPGRVLVDTGEASGLLLLDYDEGMELLWGGAAGEAGTPR